MVKGNKRKAEGALQSKIQWEVCLVALNAVKMLVPPSARTLSLLEPAESVLADGEEPGLSHVCQPYDRVDPSERTEMRAAWRTFLEQQYGVDTIDEDDLDMLPSLEPIIDDEGL